MAINFEIDKYVANTVVNILNLARTEMLDSKHFFFADLYLIFIYRCI